MHIYIYTQLQTSHTYIQLQLHTHITHLIYISYKHIHTIDRILAPYFLILSLSSLRYGVWSLDSGLPTNLPSTMEAMTHLESPTLLMNIRSSKNSTETAVVPANPSSIPPSRCIASFVTRWACSSADRICSDVGSGPKWSIFLRTVLGNYIHTI